MKIQIEQATPDKASHIASLIMEAMNAQCCQNFAGPQHTLVDFHRMMTKLVEMEDSQYSYKNTLVAMSTDGILVGILVAYDGADVKRLRKRFIEAAIVAFGIDYSAMELETDHLAFGIVLENALAHGTDLRSTDRPRNGLVEHFNLAAVGTSNQVVDLLSIVGAAVCHSQQDALDF